MAAARQKHILHRGRSYPVTAAWHAECCIPFPEFVRMSRDELKAEIDRLLLKSNNAISERLGGMSANEIELMPESWKRQLLEHSLSEGDRKRLDVVTHHFNVRTSLDFLAGRPLSDFGFIGADQVHGNSIAFKNEGQCGCILHFIFDHHRRFEEWSAGSNERQHHPHYPKHLCEKHRHLAGNLDLLHMVVHADNRLS